jgi:type I restriction enzyme R subunit
MEAEKSDRFDVLAYVAYALPPVTRAARAEQARVYINTNFNAKQQAFLDFVLVHYVNEGVTELEPAQLRPLLRIR